MNVGGVFLEELGDQILTLLSANMTAALTAVNASRAASDQTQGITVPLPTQITYAYGQRVGWGSDQPLIAVYPLTWGVVEMGNTYGEDFWDRLQIVYAIEVRVGSDTEDTVERQAARYTNAIYTCLWHDRSLGGMAETVILKRGARVERPAAGFRVFRWEATIITETNA